MKNNTTVPSVRVFFPKDSYPPVHMPADICPCEKSAIKKVHIYYFTVFTALKSRNLFVSLSICPFPSCLFSCLTVAAASHPVAARTNSDQRQLVLPLTTSWGVRDSSLPLLPLSKDFFCSTSPFPHVRVAWASLCHCCLFASERGQSTCQHLKCPLEGACGWDAGGQMLPQPFLWALGSCSCKCWLVKSLYIYNRLPFPFLIFIKIW